MESIEIPIHQTFLFLVKTYFYKAKYTTRTKIALALQLGYCVFLVVVLTYGSQIIAIIVIVLVLYIFMSVLILIIALIRSKNLRINKASFTESGYVLHYRDGSSTIEKAKLRTIIVRDNYLVIRTKSNRAGFLPVNKNIMVQLKPFLVEHSYPLDID